MSPKTGRPIVGAEPKNKQIALRATESTVRKFQECADITGKTKTEENNAVPRQNENLPRTDKHSDRTGRDRRYI